MEAEIPNEKDVLRPGTFAHAEIVVRSDDPALLVPEEAVVAFAGI